MTLPAVAILAGGLATRLQPISLKTPKAMVLVNGEPFCAVQLRQLKRQGFSRVVFLLGKMGNQIRDFVGDGSRFGIQVSYRDDGPTLRGTGGAVYDALDLFDGLFFVTYGDTFLRYDPGKLVSKIEDTGASAVMAVLRNEDRWDRSNVVLAGDRIALYDKRAVDRTGMFWIDYGATLFRKAAFARAPERDAFDLSDLLRDLAAAGDLGGVEVAERFYEIGTPPALMEAEAFFREHATHGGS